MSAAKRLFTIIAAILATLTLVGVQLAWSLRNTAYLEAVARQAKVESAVAQILPAYAASKLPSPEATKEVFTKNVTQDDIGAALDSLNISIVAAYAGKADSVTVDLGPIKRPVTASGYSIPPGTVFASDTLELGGLAEVLQLARSLLVPTALCFIGALVLVIALGVKQGLARSVRGVSLLTGLFMGSLFLVTLAAPSLISMLINSSGLDDALRPVVADYIMILSNDAGQFYLTSAALFLTLGIILSIVASFRRNPHKKRLAQQEKVSKKPKTKPQKDQNEAW